MNAPTTLRRLAGKPELPAPLSESVLILVDAQNTYRQGILQLAGIDAALAECAVLLGRARALGTPVIHVQHDGGPASPFDIRAPIGAIAEPVAPQGGEPVVVKRHPNAFFGTDLEERLQALGRRKLVIAGFMTHMCIQSTARGAFNLGYEITVPASATATRDLPATDGGVLGAAGVQAAALAMLADVFAVVVADARAIPD
ncbi:cysteine hydrolase [Pseudothauera nasutitermitis]|uniref:Cysteine hydrolase n=1 Tax=Pseudothauera nasutitermitis TaxID=2565930 RepID=A0A4S4ASP1_9RHOO|nr:cysteine hydrolase family protein [Pseudothauera nasutitermitis]THF62852.1 cysteine hydrolase [Pseudothauera nasutitermitis]